MSTEKNNQFKGSEHIEVKKSAKVNLEQDTGIEWELRIGVRGSHWPNMKQSIKNNNNLYLLAFL